MTQINSVQEQYGEALLAAMAQPLHDGAEPFDLGDLKRQAGHTAQASGGPTPVIHHGDCLDVLRSMPDNSVDAVVCDPPYGLSNTTPNKVTDTIVRWAQGDREYIPASRGFMGATWDAFVPPVAVWDECFRVLKPGGHLVAFAGSRTHDLMGIGIRMAGFDIRDSLMWVNGAGFPKSHNISKSIDKMDATEERRNRALEFTKWMRSTGITSAQVDEITGTNMGGHFLTAASQPAVATADLFDMLRPHLPEVPERIEQLVTQRTVESQNFKAREVIGIRKGAGAQDPYSFGNGHRPEFEDSKAHTPEAEKWKGWGTALKPSVEPISLARKPLSEKTVAANTLTWGTGGINVDATRIAHGAEVNLDARQRQQVGEDNGWRAAKSLKGKDIPMYKPGGRWPANVLLDDTTAPALDEQSDGASRFFKVVEPDPPFMYAAKAPKRERPTYTTEDGQAVQHSTVKPLSIMSWLVKLVTPEGGTVLDPFAGSGTTIEAALLEGFNVIGIEREDAYLPLIQQRIDRANEQLPMAS